jgi:hypothetical protein
VYRSYKGIYTPINPSKYIGDPKNIIYRSNLEKRFFKILDANPDVVQWGSEEFFIPYYSPVDKKMHRYFVDLIVKNSKGKIFVIEIKPSVQTVQPVFKKGRSQQRMLHEAVTWATNQAKWAAAQAYCEEKGFIFKVFTEKDLQKAK